MGLGKTITTLALINENKSTDTRIFTEFKIKSMQLYYSISFSKTMAKRS